MCSLLLNLQQDLFGFFHQLDIRQSFYAAADLV